MGDQREQAREPEEVSRLFLERLNAGVEVQEHYDWLMATDQPDVLGNG